MRATPCQFHSLRVCFAGALTEGWVIHLVIDFVDILRQACSEAFQGPNCEPLWVYLLGHVPGRFARLGVSSQLVEHLCCRRAKQTLHHGPKTRLLWGTIEFCHQTPGQQRLKVHTAKLSTLIDHQFLGKSPVAPNAEQRLPSCVAVVLPSEPSF